MDEERETDLYGRRTSKRTKKEPEDVSRRLTYGKGQVGGVPVVPLLRSWVS